jgi:TfoX/Sxy family transcriptional regulator of competence genes
METITNIISKFQILDGVELAKMFGSEALKVNGKVFMIVMKEGIVYKLHSNDVPMALSISGADYFDAHKNGKKMKDWIFIPNTSINKLCTDLSYKAFEYVAETAKSKKGL